MQYPGIEPRGRRRMGAGLVLAGAAAGALALYGLMRLAAPDAEDTVSAPATPAGADLQAEPAARIRVAPLAFATTRGQATGHARALDLTPLAAIAAEAAAARAAAGASAAEAVRLAAVAKADAGASARELEAARARAAADRARLTRACRRAGLEYGPGLDRLGCGALAGLAREAAAGQLAVLRLDFPATSLHAGAAVTVDLAPGSTLVRVLGPAAAGDTRLQTPGALAVLRGDAASRAASRAGSGRILAAHIPAGSAQAGLLIPREAIVRVDGGLFVWRALAADTFQRVPLDGAVAQPGGWFVPAGQLKAGDRVVVSGAGTLLGLERAPATPTATDD